MSGVYASLCEALRVWLDRKGWTHFTSIQEQTIPAVLAGKGVLVSAPTASGKTEAVFLPIVHHIIANRLAPVAALYVAPLRALINDQAQRIESILADTGLRSAWWHGDLPHASRLKVIRHPPHVILTTPESLELMLDADSYGHGTLLSNVAFVVVDEVHAFAGTDRGAQLVSVLERLDSVRGRIATRIGLSATIGSPAAVAEWLKPSAPKAASLETICDATVRGRQIAVGLIGTGVEPEGGDGGSVDDKTARMIRAHLGGHHVLVFVGSRNAAESITRRLRDEGVHAYIHHGSLDVSERRATESAFREGRADVVIATSTLELGIDIGAVDLVIQIGAPGSATVFLQRMGRSGRRNEAKAVGFLYAVGIDELSTAIAVADLSLDGTIEQEEPCRAALWVMWHQAISMTRERDGVSRDEIWGTLGGAGAFRGIERCEFDDMMDELVASDYIEEGRGILRLGAASEKAFGQANFRNFYSVFTDDSGWSVKHDGKTIGELDRHYPVSEDKPNFFLLAGQAWISKAVDRQHWVILVKPVERARPPSWHGPGPGVSYLVAQKTLAILLGYRSELEVPAFTQHLAESREMADKMGLALRRIVVFERSNSTHAVTYLGSAVNEYLAFLLSGLVNTLPASGPIQITLPAAARVSAEMLVGWLRQLLSDPTAQSDAARTAWQQTEHPPVGKYWQWFGPQMQQQVLRHAYAPTSEVVEALRDLDVRLARSVRVADGDSR